MIQRWYLINMAVARDDLRPWRRALARGIMAALEPFVYYREW